MVLRPYYQGPFYTRIDRKLVFAYSASGFITSFSDYATFTICFSFLNSGLLIATVAAYIVGLVVSYLQNRFWVFKQGANRQSEVASLWRYATFLVINLGLTYAILWALEQFGVSPYIGKFVVWGFMYFWIYFGNKYFVFHGERTGPIQL